MTMRNPFINTLSGLCPALSALSEVIHVYLSYLHRRLKEGLSEMIKGEMCAMVCVVNAD
jgi:hypothetical protein